ncbi:hypothetical protein ACIQUS_26345 [Pseudomonas sp. NPDC090755]|uniref:hypothetical protein n=1 Tax=Pseudomonas sp. NPDC090755 TaxID=3364481 RepID=UPI003839E5C8
MRIRIDIETAERIGTRNRGIRCDEQNTASLLDNIGCARAGCRIKNTAGLQQGTIRECSGFKTLSAGFGHFRCEADTIRQDKLNAIFRNFRILRGAGNILYATFDTRSVGHTVNAYILSSALQYTSIVSTAIGRYCLVAIRCNNSIVGNTHANNTLFAAFDTRAICNTTQNSLNAAKHNRVICNTSLNILKATIDHHIVCCSRSNLLGAALDQRAIGHCVFATDTLLANDDRRIRIDRTLRKVLNTTVNHSAMGGTACAGKKAVDSYGNLTCLRSGFQGQSAVTMHTTLIDFTASLNQLVAEIVNFATNGGAFHDLDTTA